MTSAPIRCAIAGACLPVLPLLRASDHPAPNPVAPFAQNLTRNGPPIPAELPAESPHPLPIPLWPNGAPDSEARHTEPEHVSWRQERDLVFPVISNIHDPSVTPFLPAKGKANGCAVIIAPGGGHMQLTIDREGYEVARWLARRGIAGFVLKHRLARDTSTPRGVAQPYTIEAHSEADLHRAIRLVRSRAAEFSLKPNRIGVLGFSAGGELAILAALRHTPGDPDATDPIERVSSRPDFFAPIYPGGLRRDDARVREGATPPAFLVCAYDDRMPELLAAFFTHLRKLGVSAELHIYSTGGHGFGVRSDRPQLAVSGWHVRFHEWLGDRGFLK